MTEGYAGLRYRPHVLGSVLSEHVHVNGRVESAWCGSCSRLGLQGPMAKQRLQ